MKVIIINFVLAFAAQGLCAQNLLIDKNGAVSFFSAAPLEDIEAHNHQALGILNLEDGSIGVSVLIKGFKFEKALMEEHFNENYLESDRYPKAIFSGKLPNFDPARFSRKESFSSLVEGELTIHGISQSCQAEVAFTSNGEVIQSTTTFKVKIEDYGIEVPQVLINNIAEEMQVTARFNLTQQGS